MWFTSGVANPVANPHDVVCLQVMAQHGPGLTPSALDAMTYTDAVIKEVLRVTPPSASVFRKATVDLEVNRMPLGGGGGGLPVEVVRETGSLCHQCSSATVAEGGGGHKPHLAHARRC
jgi:hypothetical protein